MTQTSLSSSLIREERRMMGTTVEIIVSPPAHMVSDARRQVQAAFDWLTLMAATLTRFEPESELMRLNHNAGQPFTASPILYDCLQVALALAAETDGLFDPAVLPHVLAAGYDQDFDQIAHRDIGREAMILPPTGQWRAITLDAANHTIMLPLGVQIDLGGIAKGWAADCIARDILGDFPDVLVNVGGDIAVRGGTPDGQPWAISLDDPRYLGPGDAPYLAVVTPGKGGLATSGANRRWWRRGETVAHHIIDPRTGQPASIWTPPADADPHTASYLIATASALAPTAAAAEAAAKVALLRGFPAALEAVEASARAVHTVSPALILILGSGEVHHSLNLTAWFANQGIGQGLWVLNS